MSLESAPIDGLSEPRFGVLHATVEKLICLGRYFPGTAGDQIIVAGHVGFFNLLVTLFE